MLPLLHSVWGERRGARDTRRRGSERIWLPASPGRSLRGAGDHGGSTALLLFSGPTRTPASGIDAGSERAAVRARAVGAAGDPDSRPHRRSASGPSRRCCTWRRRSGSWACSRCYWATRRRTSRASRSLARPHSEPRLSSPSAPTRYSTDDSIGSCCGGLMPVDLGEPRVVVRDLRRRPPLWRGDQRVHACDARAKPAASGRLHRDRGVRRRPRHEQLCRVKAIPRIQTRKRVHQHVDLGRRSR